MVLPPGSAIWLTGVGKRYRLGHQQAGYSLLTEAITERVRRLGRPGSRRQEFWALRDIEFEVGAGERLGVIGHNGAGKSTLLKLLARVTPPTTGRIDLRGRVGALLEVGTGFNGELSGRENVFLNGAILGMRRAEIAQKFDEIVDFAGVEQFIDTPVKRYSSGMYLRLAFAVAAHLEPDVLIVDEVLAVGDLAFQEKCIGRMERVANEGRTVMFVSHNLAAVRTLCPRAILLSAGRKATEGPTDDVIQEYVRTVRSDTATPIRDRSDRDGTGRLRFTEVRIDFPSGGEAPGSGEDVEIVLAYEGRSGARLSHATFHVTVYSALGALILQCQSETAGARFDLLPASGEVRLRIPKLPLPPGRYFLNVFSKVSSETADWVQRAAELTVTEGDFYGTGRMLAESHQTVLVAQQWSLTETPVAEPVGS
jgi:lipopolysaccharide transport system ATP-binding protein